MRMPGYSVTLKQQMIHMLFEISKLMQTLAEEYMADG